MIGKTIARVETPTHPEYGYEQHGTLVLYFTDGTTAEITGHSYEEVSLSYGPGEDPRVYARAAQGRRERERLVRLEREEHAAAGPEERARRETVRRSEMSPFALAVEDSIRDMARSTAADMNRVSFGNTFTIPIAKSKGKARRS